MWKISPKPLNPQGCQMVGGGRSLSPPANVHSKPRRRRAHSVHVCQNRQQPGNWRWLRVPGSFEFKAGYTIDTFHVVATPRTTTGIDNKTLVAESTDEQSEWIVQLRFTGLRRRFGIRTWTNGYQ